jgi:hypothetical protein
MSRMSNPKPARRQRRRFTDEFKAGLWQSDASLDGERRDLQMCV